MVKQAQGEKPPVQQLADKISAIFVPVVLGIAVITLIVNWIIIERFYSFADAKHCGIGDCLSLCNGFGYTCSYCCWLGTWSKKWNPFRNATSLELFKDIKQVVFDKTGTLTTGNL